MSKNKPKSPWDNPLEVLSELVNGATGQNIVVFDNRTNGSRTATILIPGGFNVRSQGHQASKKFARTQAAREALYQIRNGHIELPVPKKRQGDIEIIGLW